MSSYCHTSLATISRTLTSFAVSGGGLDVLIQYQVLLLHMQMIGQNIYPWHYFAGSPSIALWSHVELWCIVCPSTFLSEPALTFPAIRGAVALMCYRKTNFNFVKYHVWFIHPRNISLPDEGWMTKTSFWIKLMNGSPGGAHDSCRLLRLRLGVRIHPVAFFAWTSFDICSWSWEDVWDYVVKTWLWTL